MICAMTIIFKSNFFIIFNRKRSVENRNKNLKVKFYLMLTFLKQQSEKGGIDDNKI